MKENIVYLLFNFIIFTIKLQVILLTMKKLEFKLWTLKTTYF